MEIGNRTHHPSEATVVPDCGDAHHHPQGPLHIDSRQADHRPDEHEKKPRPIIAVLAGTAHRAQKRARGCRLRCGGGLGVDTAAVDALVGKWARLEAPTGHTQGQREGTRGSQDMRRVHASCWLQRSQ